MRIHHDHAGLRGLQHEVEESLVLNSREKFWDAFDRLVDHTKEHIELELGEKGFFQEIEKQAPRLQHRIKELHRDHELITKAFDEIRALKGKDFERAKKELMGCLSIMKQHEDREEQMISDFLYQDVGSPLG